MHSIRGYLGFDVGSISTKAVVTDSSNRVLARSYLWTEGDPIGACRRVLRELEPQVADSGVTVVSVGVTGSARELIGAVLEAQVVRNEITAHALGTLAYHPEARTIFEIGGQDSKLIVLEDGIVTDYAMNTLCAAGTGSFLSSQARRLNIPVEEFGSYALRSSSPVKIAGRCTVFAESDLVHKAQMGHSREDLIAGLCRSIVYNYLNNVGKGKRIRPPIVFQGGVSKNVGVVRAFSDIVGHEVVVDEMGHLMGCVGAAVLARECEREVEFAFEVAETDFRTVGVECVRCPNSCEIVCVLRDGILLDAWGNRCPAGAEDVRKRMRRDVPVREPAEDDVACASCERGQPAGAEWEPPLAASLP